LLGITNQLIRRITIIGKIKQTPWLAQNGEIAWSKDINKELAHISIGTGWENKTKQEKRGKKIELDYIVGSSGAETNDKGITRRWRLYQHHRQCRQ
jgi:hypothetical protein